MVNSIPINPDVVVIGAGTSGLSAAKTLKSLGYSVVVVEADAHVGGRCITDRTTFQTPFDVGGSWLHSAASNPLARLAETYGVPLHKKAWDSTWVHSNGTTLTPEQVSEYAEYQTTMWQAINDAGSGADDISVEMSLPSSPWKNQVKNLVAPMLAGDPDVTSSADVYHFLEAEGDWLVEGGLGAFIHDLHIDVDVVLNCPVTEIDYSGAGVKIQTPKGLISARYAVVTVSTGVMAAEQIKFTPALPDWKQAAINSLPTGLLNKIGIEFNADWQEAHQGQSADYLVGDSDFCTLEFGFYDTSLAVGFVAGRFAEQLENAGPETATNFCIEGLKSTFGSNITKHIRKTTETAWNGNSFTHGSYSYARPGGAGARSYLAKTLDDKLFFAGEATMLNTQATVHGAYLSGKDVAQRVHEITVN